MEAHKTLLVRLFSGDDVRYVIPVFQRNYNWTNKQCKQLFNDICDLIGNDNYHFFGSIVLLNDRHNSWSIIDGQQRLTTVSLMWLAMTKIIKNKDKEANNIIATNIRNKYCYASMNDGSTLPRIVHVEKDQKAFMALIEGIEDKFIKDSNVTRNFFLFYEWIKTSNHSLQEFYDAISRLLMVKIELDDEDNPQLIFESLNSTGLALSAGDEIRNFLLMNLKVREQNDYYKNYWMDIEHDSNYSHDEKNQLEAVTFFVRDYMTAKTTHIPPLHDVYFKFKEFANKKNISTQALLEDMKKYARYLYELENGETTSVKINHVLKRIALLEMSVLHPFELNLLNGFYAQKFTENDMLNVLSVVENFIFRRLICEVPTNALNKIFATLYEQATDLAEKVNISFYDAVVYLLTSKQDSGRFPDDNEFREAWATKNIYKMRPKNKIYIFYRLNAGTNREGDTSVISKMQTDKNGNVTLSIEHIMPQTLSTAWKQALGGEVEAQKVQDRWEHTIANLTLTAYNSSYSNNSFQNKLTLEDENGNGIGFKYSPLHINDYIKQQIEWGETQLQERLTLIQDEASNIIWPMPKSIYTPTILPNEELTVENDYYDFTGKDFVDGTLNGNSIVPKPTTSWKDVFMTIIKMLDRDYHYDLVRMANDEKQMNLQNESTKYEKSTQVLDGIYALLNTSTATKISTLHNILEYLGLDDDAIVFHVKNSKNSSGE